MDVFRLRENVVGEYGGYVEGFVRVLDPHVDAFVRERLGASELWPEAVLQTRYTISPDARREVLRRLREPNLRIAEAQAASVVGRASRSNRRCSAL